MDAVLTGAQQLGWPEESLHREYFSAPEAPEYENHPFNLVLQRSGRKVEVSAEQDAARALIEAGVHVNLKCSDGICGVCKCQVLSGDVEHRDFVLSAAQRREAMILCQSRAAQAGGEIVLDL
jgi:ferredoxin